MIHGYKGTWIFSCDSTRTNERTCYFGSVVFITSQAEAMKIASEIIGWELGKKDKCPECVKREKQKNNKT